ncbi:MAG: two-component regulator propeller domain-containing protein, partial [Bacteroidota bacterium]|nr:two-component regulator propeller domain-containing protein [Bacteroidota bacterium]
MNKYTKILFLISVLWILSNHIIGQTSFVFHHLGTRDGLSNSGVTSILKDSYGFLWVGTGNGLNRYDGYGFKVYMVNPGVPNTLLSNNIIGLQEDGLRNIWVDFGYGYAVYNREKDCFETDVKKFLENLGIKTEGNSKVFVDKLKNLLVFNGNNIYIYNVRGRSLICLRSRVKIDGISSVGFSNDNLYFYVIQTKGVLWKMNKRTGKQTIIKIPDYIQKLTLNNYGKIFVDSKNGLWIYSYKNDQLFYKRNDGQDWKTIELKSDIQAQSNVRTIVEDQNGQIWIGTDHKGLFVYNQQDGTLRNLISQLSNQTTLSANNITCILIDNTGTVWIGHNKKGMSFYNESFHFFSNVESNKFSDISRIMENTTGEILLGTDGDGLYMKDKTGIVNKFPIPNTAITSMIEDKKGRIWIGTYQKGVFCYDQGKFSQFTTSNSSLSDNNVWSLQEDRFGSIWIGTLGGKLHKLEAGSSDFKSLKTPYDNIIQSMDMAYDGGDKLYVGTSFGLMNVDVNNNKRVYCYANAKGTQRFRNQQITSVYKGKNNILWLGGNTGLTAWDMKKDTLYYLDVSNGLCDNIIQGIVEDNLQNVWVTTSKGMSALTVNRNTNETLTIDCKNFFVKD